jgi:uridine kinase
LLEEIADVVAGLQERRLVAIDGVDGAGKTTFADRLAPMIEARGRSVVRASVDGFHNPRSVRYRRGRSDPMGYFADSYDYAQLRERLLEPFRDGAESVCTKCFDHHADGPDIVSRPVDDAAILLIDGIFLHRDELFGYWDYSVFLRVPFDVAFRRMATRDGTDPDPAAEGNKRYREGQRIYLGLCRPEDRASRTVDG